MVFTRIFLQKELDHLLPVWIKHNPEENLNKSLSLSLGKIAPMPKNVDQYTSIILYDKNDRKIDWKTYQGNLIHDEVKTSLPKYLSN